MLTAYAASATEAGEQVASGTALELANLISAFLGQIPLIFAGGIVIFLAYLAAQLGRTMVMGKLAERIEDEHKEIQILGGRMTYSGILIIGVTVGLKIAGIDLTSIIAAGAFGIGFALKDLIMNFLAGVMILLGRNFSIGDFINVGGTLGKVVEIQSRVTILQAIDGTKVIVPNADLFKKQVTSYTSNPFRRIEIIVGVDYRTNLNNALKICMKTLKETKGVLLEPKPAVILDSFADSSINIKMRAWVDSKGGWIKVKSRVILKLKDAFDEHNITIPWPIRTVVYDKEQDYEEKMLEEKIEETAVAEAKAEVAAPAEVAKVEAGSETPKVEITAQADVKTVEVPAELSPAAAPSSEFEQPLKPLGEQRPSA